MTPTLLGYGVCLMLHTYLRWGVLLAGIAAVASSVHGWSSRRRWSRVDETIALAFIGLTDLQLLLGLLLYLWLSPISEAALGAGLRVSSSEPSLLFFGYLHPALMIAGFVVAHATRARSKRATDDSGRFRRIAVGLTVWLALVLLAIPWPWLGYGRPLFRPEG